MDAVGDQLDRDNDIRNELKNDAIAQCQRIGKWVDAILITGDIAHAGKQDEYTFARNWLRDLCEGLNCEPGKVFTVPGNHDVDRSVIQESPIVSALQNQIRRSSGIEDELARTLRDEKAANLLFAPIKAYNDFALGYESNCGFRRLWWQRDFRLSEAPIVLRIVGLTSTILSGPDDRRDSLFLGERQCTQPNRDGYVYLSLCHHPPDWFSDSARIEDRLIDRVKIQLFGHQHLQRVRGIEDCVRISAGALHPDRKETGWKPGYNLIWIEGRTDGGKSCARVKVYSREWRDTPRITFFDLPNANGRYPSEYTVPVYQIPPGSENGHRDDDASTQTGIPSSPRSPAPIDSIGQTMAIIDRELLLTFAGLSFSKKNEILGSLDLLEESDSDAPDHIRFLNALKKAQERGLWQELTTAVSQASVDGE